MKENVTKKPEKKHGLVREILGWVIYLIILIVAVGLINTYVGQRVQVDGASMEHTLQDKDSLILNKLSYHFSDPKRFDIVVFPNPGNEEEKYIKRVIGLPNETIQINEKGEILIDGEVLEESFGAEVIQDADTAANPILLGEDEYFVMGDNRNWSRDSRDPDVGPIHRDKILGKAFIRIWPLNTFKILKHQ